MLTRKNVISVGDHFKTWDSQVSVAMSLNENLVYFLRKGVKPSSNQTRNRTGSEHVPRQ